MEYWADARPAWLWSGDGSELLWRNGAARFFLARIKKSGPKLLAAPVPIKGQVPRLVRLGTPGRSSLSRLQFLAGGRPISATCAVTPLQLPDGGTGLLVVAVDPIDPALAQEASADDLTRGWLPAGAEFVVFAADGSVLAGSPLARSLGSDAAAGDGMVKLDGRLFAGTRFQAGPKGEYLVVLEPLTAPPPEEELPVLPVVETPEPEAHWETDLDAWAQADGPEELAEGPVNTRIDPEWAEVEAAARASLNAPEEPEVIEEAPSPAGEEPEATQSGRLSGLFEKLSQDEDLYAPLSADETEEPEEAAEPEELEEPPVLDDDAPPSGPGLVRVVGRGFLPNLDVSESEASEPEDLPEGEAAPNEDLAIAESAEAEPESPVAAEEPAQEPASVAEAPAPPQDAEAVERVSRYNFDELSRILNDRVSGELGPQSRRTSIEEIIERDAPAPTPASTPPAATGSLINLGGETLVLNRLPLGILVFRDQQVLFANRAITEMIGYESVESLRAAGLASIFPAASDEQPEAGPVNHLMQRDGTLVPVTARLQSISWQGRPALMLSASATEVRTGHEGAVRAFAEMLADTRDDGFIEATRSGVISGSSAQARVALQLGEQQLRGQPLSSILDRTEHDALRAFLERPARFAETARPVLVARGKEPGLEVMLFAQGQAGIVTGYFGFVRRRDTAVPRLPARSDTDSNDPALLERLSRGLRRPLNTVIGFSDLIASAAFGEVGNPRYQEYAQDIKTAGQEITALVDELDDFARLRDGRYAPRPSDVDLAALLESCVIRVRGQASAARVLVRSAISERIPRIRADRASLGQAVLNLLASAIDQTPVGGAVVLSAQLDDDGSISVHVRDSANRETDQSERFVVFRDGVSKDGEVLAPIRSTVGLALTRSLLAVNACSLSVDPAGSVGTIFSLVIPRELVTKGALPPPSDENLPTP